ncbi:uncharacterized protein [Hetaerina americana]|uniref:uncharacterized protein n=1 Tax=Hetaerina americana TaxID=62018 RepID=UPI003A7F48B1
MGAAWKIVLLVVMVGALAAAIPSPAVGGEVEQASDPVEDSPSKHTVETLGPVNPKRPPNTKDNGAAETRSETDRASNGGFFEDIFNIPIKVLEAVRDMIKNRGQPYTKKNVNGDALVPDGWKDATASPS